MGSLSVDEQSYDFIVVGGGTAGNVVAGRLAENPNVSVLLTTKRANDHYPARAFELRNSKYDWGYKATMINRPDYERVEKPHTRGKTLGGCSALNYYTWVRGSHGTYDDWKNFGGPEWNIKFYNPRLAKVGRKGPLDVAISDMVPELETFRNSLTNAWVSKGERLTENIYEGTVNGLVKFMNTIYKGVRSTSAVFLDGHPNITLMAETHTNCVLIDDNVAVGAKKEVIISAGVFESPKLLMLPGVGPKKQLEDFGIKCIVDSPHVGQNLLDHPIMPHVFKLKDGCGLDSHLLRADPMQEAAVQAYQKDHKGPLHRHAPRLNNHHLIGNTDSEIMIQDQGATTVDGVFPGVGKGEVYYDWYTLSAVNASAGANVTIDAPLGHIPVYVRGNTVIPTQEPALVTRDARRNHWGVIAALSLEGSARGTLYVDDGESLVPNATLYVEFTASNNALYASGRGMYKDTNPLANITVLGVQDAVTNVSLNGMAVPSSGVSYNMSSKALTVTGLNNATSAGAWSMDWVLRWG